MACCSSLVKLQKKCLILVQERSLPPVWLRYSPMTASLLLGSNLDLCQNGLG